MRRSPRSYPSAAPAVYRRHTSGMDDEKQAVRERVWRELRRCGAARFPGAEGRIPNFTGAEAAARLLATRPEWQRARVLKSNPDLPQLSVRAAALEFALLVESGAIDGD